MPVCFQLYRLGSRTPASLHYEVDGAICAYLEVPMSETKYCCGWYDYIGLLLAMGKSFAEIADGLQRDIAEGKATAWTWTMLRINHFLCENYSSDAWWEPK